MVNKEEFRRIILGKRKIQLELEALRKKYRSNPNSELEKELTLKHKELVTFK